MRRSERLAPKGARPLEHLPFFALAAVRSDYVDEIVHELYAAVENAGGRSSGRSRTCCQFIIGRVRASIDLSTGWASMSTTAKASKPKQQTRLLPAPAKTFPEADAEPFEPDFVLEKHLEHAGFVWTIECLPETGDSRAYEINTVVLILQGLGAKYRQAVVQIMRAGSVGLHARLDATSGFQDVHRHAVPNCSVDWAAMRLWLSDGRTAEEAMFSPALGQAPQLLGQGQPSAADLARCRRIGQVILAAFPSRVWGSREVADLMRELAPPVSEQECRRLIAELKRALPATSPWRTGGRPPAIALREAMLPILEREGIIARRGTSAHNDQSHQIPPTDAS